MTRLPPVRRPVPLRLPRNHAIDEALRGHFPSFNAHLFESGTAALAAALIDARSRSRRSMPEALIPAYGCPDLVAACVCAGVRPKLVDVVPDAWGYDLKALQAAITNETVAVVAVNLMGVGDQALELGTLVRDSGIALIQDSAQYLPDQTRVDWPGDYVVLSFGRGKPLNLLHGGALLARPDRSPALGAVGAPARGLDVVKHTLLSGALAALVFNTLTHPQIYGIAMKLPGLGVGQTQYSALETCTRLSARFGARVAAAFAEYASQRNYRTGIWRTTLRKWEAAGIRELRCATGSSQDEEQRLRLPLLAPTRAVRDRIVESLHEYGLGASAMYEHPLQRITGIPMQICLQQGPFPGAVSIADRLFTLPTHSCVDEATVARVDALVATAAGLR